MHGCRLLTVHSAVPLSERHALSIGVVMVAGSVCFGIYADAAPVPRSRTCEWYRVRDGKVAAVSVVFDARSRRCSSRANGRPAAPARGRRAARTSAR